MCCDEQWNRILLFNEKPTKDVAKAILEHLLGDCKIFNVIR